MKCFARLLRLIFLSVIQRYSRIFEGLGPAGFPADFHHRGDLAPVAPTRTLWKIYYLRWNILEDYPQEFCIGRREKMIASSLLRYSHPPWNKNNTRASCSPRQNPANLKMRFGIADFWAWLEDDILEIGGSSRTSSSKIQGVWKRHAIYERT